MYFQLFQGLWKGIAFILIDVKTHLTRLGGWGGACWLKLGLTVDPLLLVDLAAKPQGLGDETRENV